MNTDHIPECIPEEGNMPDTCSGAVHLKPKEEVEQIELNEVQLNIPSSVDEMDSSEEMTPMKPEQKDRRDHQQCLKEEEEGEYVSDSPFEEGLNGERPEEMEEDEEQEGDEEADVLNEAQDLSLVDYARYKSTTMPDAHNAATAGTYISPHSQTASKLNCDICGLSCVSINVLLVHKRSHTGERPFHCSQCGASFTQKGNLLRHIKLHSGEKPFKCPMCNYACRRRDALSGHLRTHSVEKPHKCNHCGRSYKQRSSLEEHRERCHVYIRSKDPIDRDNSHTSRAQMGTERALLLDKLASNVAKRKSSMPQKFTGDNGVCLDLSFKRELTHPTDIMDPPLRSPGPDIHLHQPQPILTDPDPDSAPSHRHYAPLAHNDMSPLSLTNGQKLGLPPLGLSHTNQPPERHPGVNSLHTDTAQITQTVTYSLEHLLGGSSNHNGIPYPHAQPVPVPPMGALRVIRANGESGVHPGVAYPCGHCKVIFLDYVMFTIHMGCHGFRDPLECNVCGHRSRDRYEFSSHIVRGEHRLDAK